MTLEELQQQWEHCSTCNWMSTIASIPQWMAHAEQCEIHKRNQERQQLWQKEYYGTIIADNKETKQHETTKMGG